MKKESLSKAAQADADRNDDLDADVDETSLDAAAAAPETELDADNIPEVDSAPDSRVTAELPDEAPPVEENSADDLTADTLIGDPRDEQPLSAHWDDQEPLTQPRVKRIRGATRPHPRT